MALSTNEKLARQLQFLSASHDPEIYVYLERRGFDEEVRQECWDLFRTATGAKLQYVYEPGDSSPSSQSKAIIGKIDDYENEWYPVVDATLERHYPDLHKDVFLNLGQKHGREVVVSVMTLLDRVDTLKATEEGTAALALLSKRGFDEEVRKEGRQLLETLESTGTAQIPAVTEESRLEQERAIEESWAWYREWSTIARTVVKRGDLLIRLGLRKPSKRGGQEGENDV